MIVTATVLFPDSSRFILVDDFFEQSTISSINQLFYSDADWEAGHEFTHYPGRQIYRGTSPVLEQIKTHATQIDIGSQLGVEVEFLGVDLWKDSTGYRIIPHRDIPGPDYAVQIYMGEGHNTFQMLGTAIYTEKQSHTTPLFEISYRPNSGYIVDAPHTVLHGLNHAIPPDYQRYSIYLRYRKK
jgi:hypothetical protein